MSDQQPQAGESVAHRMMFGRSPSGLTTDPVEAVYVPHNRRGELT